MTKKIFTLALAMLMFAWAGIAQSSKSLRGEKDMKLTSVNMKLGHPASKPLKAGIATKDGSTVNMPWSWDFADSAATASTWTTTDSTDAWTWYGPFGNNGNGCLLAMSSEWMVTPGIIIPATANSPKLSYYIYGEGDYVAYFGYPTLSIYISTTGNNIQDFDLANPVQTATSTSYFERQIVDLSAYAGQTIYIAFACDAFYSYLVLDDVKVAEATVPEYQIVGDYYARTGEDVVFEAAYVDGDTTQTTTFSWSSAIGTITGTDETATVNYTTTGIDTITLITSNSYGADTAVFYVQVISCGTITSLPYTESFEDLTTAYCWKMVNASATATTEWNIFSSANYAYDGSNFLYTAYDTLNNSDCYAISPAIQMPADASGYSLTYYTQGRTGGEGNYPVYEVLVSTTDDQTSSFTAVLRDTIEESGYNQRVVSLASYAGQTIYIAFRNVAEGDLSDLFIDYVQVRSTEAPVFSVNGPAMAIVGIPASFTATYAEGDTTGMTYSWTSTMAAAGQATIAAATAATTTINYTAAGNDVVVFHASNAHGDYYDTLNVQVISCDNITAFPWTEDFEGETANCWMLTSPNAADPGFEIIASQYAHSGQNNIWGNYSDDFTVDQWAISPAIEMPAEASNYVLEFYVLTTEYQGIYSDYEVLLSNGGTAYSDFATVLMSESGVASDDYVRKTIALDEYAGQTIRIAFHNKTAMGGDAMMIDDVNIHSANEPVFTVAGPTSVYTSAGAATFTATYVEGAQEGMTYSWTSSMVDAGQATITGANTTTASITYTAGGTDQVIFTATNAHGTYADTIDVTVIHCEAITAFPYVENFENNETLGCWANIDADGDGYAWEVFQGANQETGVGYGHNSNGAAFSASYVNNVGALTPDNWLIGPGITLPEGSNLEFSWYAKAMDANYADENYSVYISTTGSSIADFSSEPVYTGMTTGEWVRQNVSLANYAGQTIYFAFRHHNCTDMYYLVIDDVQIAEPGSINTVSDLGVSIYPNPASNMLRVEGNDVRMVEMLDVNGRMVLTATESNTIDLSGLAAGVYMVRVTTLQGVATEKVIKR